MASWSIYFILLHDNDDWACEKRQIMQKKHIQNIDLIQVV